MPVTLEALVHDALLLPSDQRLLLARRLLDNVDLASDAEMAKHRASSTILADAIAKYQSDLAVAAAIARLSQSIARPEITGGRKK